MLTKLTGGRIYDPAHGVDGVVRDIYIRDGRIVVRPRDNEPVAQEYNLRLMFAQIFARMFGGTASAYF